MYAYECYDKISFFYYFKAAEIVFYKLSRVNFDKLLSFLNHKLIFNTTYYFSFNWEQINKNTKSVKHLIFDLMNFNKTIFFELMQPSILLLSSNKKPLKT